MSSSAADTPDLSGLIELARDPHLDLKPVVLRVQTDLFLAAPIRDRAVLEAFHLLATGLIPTVDEETATIVARKLAPCLDTPEPVLVSLAKRGGAVCEALLDAATHLPPKAIAAARKAGFTVDAALEARLSEASTTHGPLQDAPASAIASAAVPGPTAADEPSLDEDFSEGWIGERQRGPSLTEQIRDARNDRDRACFLLAREDLADADLAPLWLHAERQQRAAIRAAVEVTAALRPCPPAPRGLAETLVDYATQRDVTGFVAALAQGLGVPADFLAMAPDASSRYDLLALGLRAADLRDSDAIHVFLTLNDTVARSVSRVFELANLYRSTGRAAARDLVSAILDLPLPERTAVGEHQPYLAPDTARPRAAAAADRALSRSVPSEWTRRMG